MEKEIKKANTTKEERKELALKIMKQLDIYKPYIKGFEKNNEVCFFERFAGYWAWQNEDLETKIKELEEKYNCTVYAITHNYTEFGELYSFLIITDYKEEWNDLVIEYSEGQHSAFAYVWNKTDDYLSEFGTILVDSLGGGIRRIA